MESTDETAILRWLLYLAIIYVTAGVLVWLHARRGASKPSLMLRYSYVALLVGSALPAMWGHLYEFAMNIPFPDPSPPGNFFEAMWDMNIEDPLPLVPFGNLLYLGGLGIGWFFVNAATKRNATHVSGVASKLR